MNLGEGYNLLGMKILKRRVKASICRSVSGRVRGNVSLVSMCRTRNG